MYPLSPSLIPSLIVHVIHLLLPIPRLLVEALGTLDISPSHSPLSVSSKVITRAQLGVNVGTVLITISVRAVAAFIINFALMRRRLALQSAHARSLELDRAPPPVVTVGAAVNATATATAFATIAAAIVVPTETTTVSAAAVAAVVTWIGLGLGLG